MSTVESFDRLAEDIWLTLDRERAGVILEAYADDLSEYACMLLCEVIFGPEIEELKTNV